MVKEVAKHMTNEQVWFDMHGLQKNEDGVRGIHLVGIGEWKPTRYVLKWLRERNPDMLYRSRYYPNYGVYMLQERRRP
jgi:alpha/beta superfamily hydrolase